MKKWRCGQINRWNESWDHSNEGLLAYLRALMLRPPPPPPSLCAHTSRRFARLGRQRRRRWRREQLWRGPGLVKREGQWSWEYGIFHLYDLSQPSGFLTKSIMLVYNLDLDGLRHRDNRLICICLKTISCVMVTISFVQWSYVRDSIKCHNQHIKYSMMSHVRSHENICWHHQQQYSSSDRIQYWWLMR